MLGRISFMALLVSSQALFGCSDEGRSYAGRVQSPMELIGGPGALGAVGDYLLANNKVRVIIQDKGWSRGFGVFGGGIIDADIIRPGTSSDATGGGGRDNFGEAFPAFFLQAFDVEDQTIRTDGCGGYCPMGSTCVLDDTATAVCLTNDTGCGASCIGSKACVSQSENETVCLDIAESDGVDAGGVEVINDGSDGGAAIVRTRSTGGNFMTLITFLLEFAVPQDAGLRYETDYILHPGARHVEIIGRLVNDSGRAIEFSGEALAGILGVSDVQIPMGDILLFGGGNDVFAAGAVSRTSRPESPKPAGFDLRYTVEASYDIQRENGVALPALPGLVTDFLATRGDGVSYGFAVAADEQNYAYKNRDQYGLDPQVTVTQESFVIPFLFSSFTGAYYAVPPAELAAHEAWEYKRYLLIGDGDVGSIRNEFYNIRNVKTASFGGEVRDAVSGLALHGGMVHVYDDQRRPYSQVDIAHDGRFTANLPHGDYYWVVTAKGRHPFPNEERFSDFNKVSVVVSTDSDGETHREDAFKRIRLPSAGLYDVDVRDQHGRALPAKVSFVAKYELPERCTDCDRLELDCDLECAPRSFLFEMTLGEDRRPTDLNWNDREGGEFVEEIAYTQKGQARGEIRPGTYDVYTSRGIEYDLDIQEDVVIQAGKRTDLSVVLTRTVDTSDYVSADLHLHSAGSLDSSMDLETRVLSGVAEGLEVAVSTDHNFITDYEPSIVSLGLQDWMTSMVGVEVSTLEMGHFNAFPLAYEVGAASHFPFVEFCYEPRADKSNQTAFDWVECNPGQIFDHVRKLGQYHYDSTIVQVNHPRDSVLGYFSQYYMDPYTAVPEDSPSDDNYSMVSLIHPQNSATGQFEREHFSFDFDSLEVFNGKRMDQLHAFRLPADQSDAFYAKRQAYECPNDTGHPQNGPGQVLLRHGGHIAFPGVVDDWMNMLNRGIKVTATGNSDSHSGHEEIGFPRNYVYVQPETDTRARRDEPPSQIHELEVVDGIQAHQVIVTNGPFLNLSVRTARADGGGDFLWRVGQTVEYASSNAGREVEILIELSSADWIGIDQILLWGNGEIIETIDVPTGTGTSGRAVDDKTLFTVKKQFAVDTWILAEAYGSSRMFPVVPPKEDPPSNISDALEGIVGGIGLDTDAFGAGNGITSPTPLQRATPYALTNPIYLDIDASGKFDALYEGDRIANAPTGPGPAPAAVPGWECNEEKRFRSELSTPEFRRKYLHKQSDAGRRYKRRDIRRIFDAMHPH